MDLIDREKLIRQIRLQANRSSLGETSCRELTFGEVAGLIMDAQTVDAEPVRHGEWIVCGDGEYVPFVCSACGKTTSWYHAQTAKYCPNCGAKMEAK